MKCDACPASDSQVTIQTLVHYLFGSSRATLTLASHRNTFWLGFILVISAGFAREYDGADLHHEPWHLLVPVAASVGSSLILFLLVEWVVRSRGVDGSRFWPRYCSFLGLYWMTAPLSAWFYAIPVERFLSAIDASNANLVLLGIVSVWRSLSDPHGCSPFSMFQPPVAGNSWTSCLWSCCLPARAGRCGNWHPFDFQLSLEFMGGVRSLDAESIMLHQVCGDDAGDSCLAQSCLRGQSMSCLRKSTDWSWQAKSVSSQPPFFEGSQVAGRGIAVDLGLCPAVDSARDAALPCGGT